MLSFILHLALALALGLVIGLERQLTGHPIGIKMNALVCLGAYIFVEFAKLFPGMDVSRVSAQVIAGVGFLCTGILFKSGSQIRGLTTATTMWVTAGIGMLLALQHVGYALVAALALTLFNLLLGPLEDRIIPFTTDAFLEQEFSLEIVLDLAQRSVIRKALMGLLKAQKGELLLLERTASGLVLGFSLRGGKKIERLEELVQSITTLAGVESVDWDAH